MSSAVVYVNMQVVRKNFKDLTYVHVKGDNVFSQHLVVYTDSKDDRDLLMVRSSYPSFRWI